MTTDKQALGDFGEVRVCKTCHCPRCKRPRTLRRLPKNFRCADVICDFCGFLAQVKATTVTDLDRLPSIVPGGAWDVQKQRMDAGIYFPPYLVLVKTNRRHAIYYLPADFQQPAMFTRRQALSERAQRPGWRGFYYDLRAVERSKAVRIR